MTFTRRTLLKSAAVAPLALSPISLRWLPGGDDVALVVLELEGGNDGLNTVIPTDPAYGRARPSLRSAARGGHATPGGAFVLHPSLRALARSLDDCAAIVHGVGYPAPDRSHFRSRDIWHTADPEFVRRSAATTGWLGRAAAWLKVRGAGLPALGVGATQMPLCLRSDAVVVPVLRRVEDFTLFVDPADERGELRRAGLSDVVRAAATDGMRDGVAGAIAAVADEALRSAERLRRALQAYTAKADYPATELGRRLQSVARAIVAGTGTRLFHLTLPGFDTHARQLPAHEALLRQLDDAVAAFVSDLRGHQRLAQTILFVHSEFGRRVGENDSLGTDHGAAGPVFVVGGGVRPGLHGLHPSLTDLGDQDLVATTDFRGVYRALLARLRIDADAVLGADAPAPIDGLFVAGG